MIDSSAVTVLKCLTIFGQRFCISIFGPAKYVGGLHSPNGLLTITCGYKKVMDEGGIPLPHSHNIFTAKICHDVDLWELQRQ